LNKSKTLFTPSPGSDCKREFKAAYANRYTWDPGFKGYKGICIWQKDQEIVQGKFLVGSDLKSNVIGIDDEKVHKAISSQLWEVSIHRVRRTFDQTHGQNTFTVGENDSVGMDVLVGGKNSGDRYRIKNNVVTMVHRNIHGTVVTIFTKSITDTGNGYLSHTYTSQYSEPTSGAPRSATNHFVDTFVPLEGGGPWVLSKRIIDSEAFGDTAQNKEIFRFVEMKLV